jgi:hypothetical protein
MRDKYPRIKLVFVPGGCTGIAQPCDVFIQRPLKHAVLTEFSKWAAEDVNQQVNNGVAIVDVHLDVGAVNLRNQGCNWILNSWKQVKEMQQTMEKGWIKCKIMPRAFETVFQLQSKIKWLERSYNCDEIHIPMGKNREIPVTDTEQIDSHLEEGEDELESTEKVAAQCVNDEEIAELLQMYEEEDY